ncbi:MAG: hypothetical protein HY669_01060 [Chloroflexi bacterium]|nr:hypothetical protein [Chloroflexota bacterium]
MASEISAIETELGQFPAGVVAEFRCALPHVNQHLSPQEVLIWAREGRNLAHASVRSWEAALQYFKVTPRILEHLDVSHIMNWASWGQRLSEYSSALSSAYFQASPEAVDLLEAHRIGEWAELGRSLYKGGWRSGAIACLFFQTSPRILRYLSLREARQFVEFIDSLAEKSHELATECLTLGETVFSSVDRKDQSAFLDLALALVQTNYLDVRPFFSNGAKVLSRIDRSERHRFTSQAKRLSKFDSHYVLSFLFDGSQALGQLDWDWHAHVLQLTEKLFPCSHVAALEFLKSCPAVIDKIGISGLSKWFEEGLATVMENVDGGIAYFSLESSKSEQMLEHLCARVELGKVREVLRMYCRAITGHDNQIVSTEALKDKGRGWTSLERPTTDGIQVFLPPFVERYDSREQNFAWIKVAATHQAAHLEYGSFNFSWERPAQCFPNLRHRRPVPPGRVDMERFFNMFANRKLARDIFTALEDSRVDWLVKHEYAGIRASYCRAQEHALAGRRSLRTMPLKEAMLEVLVYMSLRQTSAADFPVLFGSYYRVALAILGRLWAPDTRIEDTAEATIRLYRIITRLPNRLLSDEEWDAGDEYDFESLENDADAPLEAMTAPEDGDLPYAQAQPVEFRGDFKPELIQMSVKLKSAPSDQKQETASRSMENLQRLLEKGLELNQLSPGDIDQDAGLFADDLPDNAQETCVDSPNADPDKKARSTQTQPRLSAGNHTFLYDEWDYRACDYRPRWCRVRERPMNEGDAEFFDETMSTYRTLAAQIRSQFEQAMPELFKKIKRLEDGEEFDLDAVVEAIVERKSGNTPTDKVYWKRNKVERDVAVAFLLDMSASTAEALESRSSLDIGVPAADPKQYSGSSKSQAVEQDTRKYRRIIDVEKESVVLLLDALETLGDAYGLFGFSGYGRDNVEFYVIKGLEEGFSDIVKRRIDGINPLHATRMGPAVRHAAWHLEKSRAKTRILFLISDGRPQDHGYGQDAMEKDYAIHDTKMALAEARRKGIIPFCLTVDRGGQDYLRKMCADMGYELVADIESLPRRLPLLYRRLTT